MTDTHRMGASGGADGAASEGGDMERSTGRDIGLLVLLLSVALVLLLVVLVVPAS